MENMLQTPPKPPIQSKTTLPDCKTPPPPHTPNENDQSQSPFHELRKSVTPDRLRVPKAFKYPERYTSPTDMMISPVTKGLLARSRKGGAALLPPGITKTKEVGLFQNKEQILTEEKLSTSSS